MDAIYKRRSIRKYKPDPVPDEMLVSFIKAGMNAPSAGDEQPWHFVIITDRAVLEKITAIHPYAQMLHHAPAAILVCGDLRLETRKGYWVQDCSAATENILLEIAESGFGGCWLGVYPREKRVEEIRRLLGIPEHVVPFSLIAVGVPAESKEPKNEFHPARIHRNRW